MTSYRRLIIRWFNALDCEIAQVTCFNERDAADQLRAMVSDGGNEIAAGDYFKIDDVSQVMVEPVRSNVRPRRDRRSGW